jgi:adenine-specific DNA-methyltransferase
MLHQLNPMHEDIDLKKDIQYGIERRSRKEDLNMVNLIESVNKSTNDFIKKRQKYIKGQFFTPTSIAKLMAKMCNIGQIKPEVKILDPSAGTGILTIHLCQVLVNKKNVKKIHIDLYENDTKLIDILSTNIIGLDRELKKSGIKLT